MGSWKKVGKQNAGLLGYLVCFHFNVPLLFIFLVIDFDPLVDLCISKSTNGKCSLGSLTLLSLTILALIFCKMLCEFSLLILKTH